MKSSLMKLNPVSTFLGEGQRVIVISRDYPRPNSCTCTRYRRSFPTLARSDPIFYANCFDETEIYTIKLSMGSFVKDYNGPTKNVTFNL
jgi:hypothetical protein